jgi:hypothetical protein
MFTEDFHINHILDVSSREAEFRIGKYSRFYDHWFERVDNKTPAEYVNLNFRKGDVVMIESIIVSEYLNERLIFNVVLTLRGLSILKKIRKRGKIHRLAANFRRIISYGINSKRNKRSLWFITGEDFVNNNAWGLAQKQNLNIILRHNAIDGRLKVWQIGYNG